MTEALKKLKLPACPHTAIVYKNCLALSAGSFLLSSILFMHNKAHFLVVTVFAFDHGE